MSYLKQDTEYHTRAPILQSVIPFPARYPGCINEISSLNASRHCFIEYRNFIKLQINAPARSPASIFQPDLEHESGAIHQLQADGQMPFKFLPFAELSESVLVYRQCGIGSVNWILLPRTLLAPISAPRFCSQMQLHNSLPVVGFYPFVDKVQQHESAPALCSTGALF